MSHPGDPRPRYAVVDASVSLKWLLDDEDEVAKAVTLRDAALDGQFQMVAPAIWLHEVVNGLVTAVRRGRIVADDAAAQLRALLRLGVRLVDPAPEDLLAQSFRFGTAAYDTAYLPLAEALGGPLWTGERRFYDAVHASARPVRWIGHFQSGS